jgi:hypothetical protein
MCKAICGVAAGACGGSINLHWAKGSDISDINAKFGAQVRKSYIFYPAQCTLVSFHSLLEHTIGLKKAHCHGQSWSRLCCIVCSIRLNASTDKLVDALFHLDHASYLCQYAMYETDCIRIIQ